MTARRIPKLAGLQMIMPDQVAYIRWLAERAGHRLPKHVAVRQDDDALLQFHITNADTRAYLCSVEVPPSFFPEAR